MHHSVLTGSGAGALTACVPLGTDGALRGVLTARATPARAHPYNSRHWAGERPVGGARPMAAGRTGVARGPGAGHG